MEARTLTDILKDADKAINIKNLKVFSDELYLHKAHFPLHEVIFGLEHIRDIGLAMKRKNELETLLNE